MKKLLFILLLLTAAACGTKDEALETKVERYRYKKGDIICIKEFGTKGIVQYEASIMDSEDVMYGVLFVDQYNHLYYETIRESLFTQCPR